MPRQDYDKIVKLACKPKNAPPKAKYLDALIAGTFDEHSLQDITRSLTLRVRDSNPVVVFKALITIHKLMQTGSAEQLLDHLGRNDQLRLRNISAHGEVGGYRVPSNIGPYAYYLDARIRSYRELKHDLFYLQAESNRRSTGLGANSKARRLRHLPVDKGLLREVKQVQRILDAMVRCTFYDDNLSDENTVLAFRMVIKDMLVLFQAGNEGVCNILEHYFEMSKPDATESFEIYKNFIKQTDKVVDFLAMARRLNNVINVPVPNLKHAPTSLVKALEEYLNDPNFEQNRLEYKRSLGVVEGKVGRSPSPSGRAPAAKPTTSPTSAAATSSTPAAGPSTSTAPAGSTQQKIQDFLDSIQTEQQPTMFGGPASSTMPTNGNMPMNQFPVNQFGQMGGHMMPGQMNSMPSGQPHMMAGSPQFGQLGSMPMGHQQHLQMQMTGSNPFRQSMFPQQTGAGGFLAPQMTGFPGHQGAQQPFMQPQQTGFLQPQLTGQMAFQPQRPSNVQGAMEHLSQQQMQPQPTGFLQPQTTGSNPFRQSTLGPMPMGGSLFSSQPVSPTGGSNMGLPSAPFNQPTRSNSTPIVSSTMTSSPKALVPQKTGSNNPFAPPGGIPSPPPQQPKMPSMNELAQNRMNQQYAMMTGMGGMGGMGGMSGGMGGQNATPQPSQTQPQAQSGQNNSTSLDPFAPSTTSTTNGSSAMSDIASAFALDNKPAPSNDFASQFGKMNLGNGASNSGALQPQSTGFLQPQRTGYGGSSVKPFKPTSTFGSSLMETLPPIPEPSGGTPAVNGLSAQATGFPGLNAGAAQQSGTTSPQPHPGASAFGGGAMGGMTSPGSTPGAAPFTGSAFGASGSSHAFGNNSSSPAFGNNGSSNAFGNNGSFGNNSLSSPLQSQPTGFQPTSSFGQNLVAANPAPLQAQMTGSNPFRASMMFGGGGNQGGATPGGAGAQSGGNSPFGGAFQPQQTGQQTSLFS